MSGLYNWIGNILFYLIFITIVANLLPGKKYEKYLKLFAGMVLILLVIKPLTGSLRLEDKIAYYFETITFKNETDDLKQEVLGVEKQRLAAMISQYEEAVAKDVEAMAKELGFYPVETGVTIESDRESERFGTVTHIAMTVTKEAPEAAGAQAAGAAGQAGGIGKIEAVEQVQIGQEKKPEAAAPDENLNRLRRKVEEYYGFQTVDVEIRLEERGR